ncbi:MAG TPA: DUF4870 domain-containing protein [Candidatus Baltobacteraceae bacterium]|jgi:hypothetical protein|nr:DUF4870 domain-containing protein [Candidatus Baltobacteraceae bacterium]
MPAASAGTRDAGIPPKQADANWAVLAHLCGCLWILGIPFAAPVATAVVYITKRHVSPFVADQSREAQNFQNTVAIAVVAIVVIAAFAVERLAAARATGQALETIALGATLLAALMIANVVLSVLATVAVHDGKAYRYPFCMRFIRAPSEPAQREVPFDT